MIAEAEALRALLRRHVGDGQGRAGRCGTCDVATGTYCAWVEPYALRFAELRAFEVRTAQAERLRAARRALAAWERLG